MALPHYFSFTKVYSLWSLKRTLLSLSLWNIFCAKRRLLDLAQYFSSGQLWLSDLSKREHHAPVCTSATPTLFQFRWPPDSCESKQKCGTISMGCSLAYMGSFSISTESQEPSRMYLPRVVCAAENTYFQHFCWGHPQNAPVGTLEGCCALEKLSPALFPMEQRSSLQQKCIPRTG